MVCTAGSLERRERFCVRMRPEGGFVLFMTYSDELRVVGLNGGCVAKTGEGMVWEFVKV